MAAWFVVCHHISVRGFAYNILTQLLLSRCVRGNHMNRERDNATPAPKNTLIYVLYLICRNKYLRTPHPGPSSHPRECHIMRSFIITYVRPDHNDHDITRHSPPFLHHHLPRWRRRVICLRRIPRHRRRRWWRWVRSRWHRPSRCHPPPRGGEHEDCDARHRRDFAGSPILRRDRITIALVPLGRRRRRRRIRWG